MRRVVRRPNTDSGASLILAIAFVLVVGMISAGLVGLTTSSLSNRNSLQAVRDREYAADAAIELAITQVMNLPCASADDKLADTFNKIVMRVEWTNSCRVIQTTDGTVVVQRDVTFSACAGATTCNVTNTVIRAVVNLQPAIGAATTTVVLSWSVDR